MDPFDFIPVVPPNLPGENAAGKTPGQSFAAGVASTVLPTVNFLLVLFTSFAASFAVALAAMPLASAGLVFVIGRRLSTATAWAVVYALGCAAFCFIGNTCALLLHGLLQFFHDF